MSRADLCWVAFRPSTRPKNLIQGWIDLLLIKPFFYFQKHLLFLTEHYLILNMDYYYVLICYFVLNLSHFQVEIPEHVTSNLKYELSIVTMPTYFFNDKLFTFNQVYRKI